jgi:hypothetical protein
MYLEGKLGGFPAAPGGARRIVLLAAALGAAGLCGCSLRGEARVKPCTRPYLADAAFDSACGPCGAATRDRHRLPRDAAWAFN